MDHRRCRWDRLIVTVEPHSWREDRDERILHFHSNGEPHNSISILIEMLARDDLTAGCRRELEEWQAELEADELEDDELED